MITQPSDKDLELLRDQKDWVEEVKALSDLIARIKELGKNTSIRSVSLVSKRSKSWVGQSLILIRGLRVYPEIQQLGTRNAAITYLEKKKKIRSLLE